MTASAWTPTRFRLTLAESCGPPKIAALPETYLSVIENKKEKPYVIRKVETFCSSP